TAIPLFGRLSRNSGMRKQPPRSACTHRSHGCARRHELSPAKTHGTYCPDTGGPAIKRSESVKVNPVCKRSRIGAAMTLVRGQPLLQLPRLVRRQSAVNSGDPSRRLVSNSVHDPSHLLITTIFLSPSFHE